jgi:hypothetical protein
MSQTYHCRGPDIRARPKRYSFVKDPRGTARPPRSGLVQLTILLPQFITPERAQLSIIRE